MYGKYIPVALAIVSDLVWIGECAGLPDEILPCRDSGSLKFMTPTRQIPEGGICTTVYQKVNVLLS